MRAAAVLAAAVLIAGVAHADPAPPTPGPAAAAGLQLLRDGKTAQGRETLDRLARAGDAEAAGTLGEVLDRGLFGLTANPTEACAYYAMGSERRAMSMHNLAFCYERGVIGGAPDLSRSAQLYQRAADMGYGKANCALGNLYMDGRGVAKDEVRGAALCKVGAEAGYADSQTDLGNDYLMGRGVPRDSAQARAWYEKAAAQNQRNALMTLGQIYWNGDGVTKDTAKAAGYWRRSYDAGRMDAAKFLGDEAFLRATVSKGVWMIDGLAEAHGWYEKAAKAETPGVRVQAADRAALTEQLKGVMQRSGKAG